MRKIGVTGGIGSGKSSVSNILRDFGVEIIDADIIAREIVRKGEKALKEIADSFGAEIIKADGELDRKKLGSIVFSNAEKLEVLNQITHKYIIEKIGNRVAEAEKKGLNIVAVDAAIPFKNGFLDLVGEVWAIVAKDDIRLSRIMHRDGLSYEEASQRLQSQMSQEEYVRLADKIIENNGGIEELTNTVKICFFS